MIKIPSRSEIKDALGWYRLAQKFKAGDPYHWWQRGAVGEYQEGKKTLFNQGLFEESSTAKERLGTKRELDDGRVYRYAGITAAAITASGALLSKAQTAVAATIAAADALIDLVGAREITLTIAGATADLYKDGELVVKAGTDIGSKYKVRGNVVTGNPAAGRAVVSLYDKLFVTWVAASTTIGAYQSPFKNLLINPAVASVGTGTAGEHVMGMSIRPITASYYAWLQTRGIAALVLDVAAAAGDQDYEAQIIPGPTSGRGALVAAGPVSGHQSIGELVEMTDRTTAEACLVYLTIE